MIFYWFLSFSLLFSYSISLLYEKPINLANVMINHLYETNLYQVVSIDKQQGELSEGD